MIANDAQHRLTKAYLEQFEEALANLNADSAAKPAKLRQLGVDSVQTKIDDFHKEIAEYERPSTDES